MSIYEELLEEINRLRKGGKLPKDSKREQAISFAYGNVNLSNDKLTKDVVELAYDEMHGKEGE